MSQEIQKKIMENEQKKEIENLSYWYDMMELKLKDIHQVMLSAVPQDILDTKIKDIPGIEDNFLETLDEIIIEKKTQLNSNYFFFNSDLKIFSFYHLR